MGRSEQGVLWVWGYSWTGTSYHGTGNTIHLPSLNICFKGALVVMGLLIRSLIADSLVGELVVRLKEEFNAGGGEAFTFTFTRCSFSLSLVVHFHFHLLAD